MYKLIEQKIYRGERITRDDALALTKCTDLLYLGMLARWVKRQKTQNYVYFNVNLHINLTNVCTSKCDFCAFGLDENAPEAYVMTIDEVLSNASELSDHITELHIVSALHPKLPFSYYYDIIKNLHGYFPHLYIKAFTAVEIDYFAKISGKSIREVLTLLKEAGLGSLPGGGAEVFSPRVRQALCPRKASGERWLEIMSTAHELGLKSNATMLYGHIETWEERIDHILALRELQDKTKGFQSFIPLAFQKEHTKLSHLEVPSAVENLKVIAISRLLLDNFDHIKGYWILLGLPLAQLSLEFGVDDLDGTVIEEKIAHAAGAKSGKGILKTELLKSIKDMGLIPVERDTLYNVINIYEGGN